MEAFVIMVKIRTATELARPRRQLAGAWIPLPDAEKKEGEKRGRDLSDLKAGFLGSKRAV